MAPSRASVTQALTPWLESHVALHDISDYSDSLSTTFFLSDRASSHSAISRVRTALHDHWSIPTPRLLLVPLGCQKQISTLSRQVDNPAPVRMHYPVLTDADTSHCVNGLENAVGGASVVLRLVITSSVRFVSGAQVLQASTEAVGGKRQLA